MASATNILITNILLMSTALIGVCFADHSWLDVKSSKARAIEIACTTTLYPDACRQSLWNSKGLPEKPSPSNVVGAVVNVSITAVRKVDSRCKSFGKTPGLDRRNLGAIEDCLELFRDTLDELQDTLKDLNNVTFMKIPKHSADLRTLLSASITNQYTCLESFDRCKGNYRQQLLGRLKNITHLVSNSLAMVTNMSAQATNLMNKNRRRLLNLEDDNAQISGFPSWLTNKDRRLLQSSTVTPNVVVAKDGTGTFKTITEAVNAAPNKTATRFIIKIKAGVYAENVDIIKKKLNLMFIGDGIGKTVITGNRNVIDGFTTFRSATVAVTGTGFLARDLTIENTAGAAKHQAVALRSGADLSAFYRCEFKGYQDTLYAHSLRQFYRECNIYGTVDFIFGNAAVVLQNCNLLARKPLSNQKILFTAQGRQDPNENTGISIQNCNVTAAPDLVPVKASFEAYLGRPWKLYSRTVYMQSYLDDVIQPKGWLEWNGSFALDTLYYREYMNRGPRSGTSGRVTWPGYGVINSSTEAKQFTVSQFIAGTSWLPSTGISFVSGLL